MADRRRAGVLAGLAAISFGAGAVLTSPLDSTQQEIHLAPGEQVLVIADLPATSPSPSISLSPTESPVVTLPPSPSPSPTPIPPTPTPVPPSPTPPPAPTPQPCGTALQPLIDAAPTGGTLDLSNCVYANANAKATITKAITIKRGVIKPNSTGAVNINANDVTFDGTSFDGGPGWTVRINGADRTKILNASFQNTTETPLQLVGPGIDTVLIQGTTFKISGPYSAVSCDDNLPFGQDFKNVTFRGITLDNGTNGNNWFGIECWGVQNLLIEGSSFKGGQVHISIPRSDGAIIQNNTFDLTKVTWAAIELADIDNTKVINNIAFGPPVGGGGMWNAFLQNHQGGGAFRNNLVEGNRLTNFPALFNAAEQNVSGNIVRNNCLINVTRMNWGNASIGYTLTNNGPCP